MSQLGDGRQVAPSGTNPTPFIWQGAERSWAQWRTFRHDDTGSID